MSKLLIENEQAPNLGRHILVEFYGCDPQIMNDVALIEQYMVAAAQEAQATVVNSTFHHFSPYGVSGVVVIEESHLAIHTWPEYGYAAVDIFTCGTAVNPWISYKFLEVQFRAEYGSSMELLRGQRHLLERKDFAFEPTRDQDAPRKVAQNRNIWFTDRDENIALSLRHTGDVLFREQSPYQKVQILQTYAYGKALTIDGMFMTTEHDEFVYHEMIAHVPVMAHGAVRRVLVIGGGDGGTVRELLRHKNIEKVTMVEIDEAVVRACRQHLPFIAASFHDPRLELVIGDGIAYVGQAPSGAFDLVVVDGSDPVGPAKGLFSDSFYHNVHRVLNDNGILVAQGESPWFNQHAFVDLRRCFGAIFGSHKVWNYFFFVPTYPSGMWSFALCAKGQVNPLHGVEVEAIDIFSQAQGLRYYNGHIHKASFATPNFVKNLRHDG
ncbi:MAG: polyamine aminopropyltransferase [Bacteroidetes bacterium]|nr:polyamine aminopropyltransferase [Bacteroidota bacterium]